MNALKTRPRMLGLAVVVTLSLGGAWAGVASGGPPPKPPAADKVPAAVDLPDAAVREITTPETNLSVSAIFRNGKVYRVVQPRQVFEVTKTNGAKGTRIIDGGGFFTQRPDGSLDPLPPLDPAFDHVGPTPEQAAEMRRIAGTDKPPPTPPWMPGDAPRP